MKLLPITDGSPILNLIFAIKMLSWFILSKYVKLQTGIVLQTVH